MRVLHSVLFILLVTMIGCSGSGGSSNPAAPSQDSQTPEITIDQTVSSSAGGHLLLGYSLIRIDATDPDDVKADIIPARVSSIHLNILKLLETGICTDCFKIVGFDVPEPGVIDVNIQITHPINDLSLTVFDVKGIMMFNGSHSFPASGLTMSDSWVGEGELLNAEGYTQLYNGSTLGMAGDFFTYFKGNLATDTVPNSLLNGFMRHISSDSGNTRNALLPGDFVIRKYSLKFPEFGQLVLGYAVDASWDVPLADPVTNPITDFGENANCLEPWKIGVTEFPVDDGLTEDGGYTVLWIDVYDWQGKSSHAVPMVECPELFDGTLAAEWKEDHTSYTRYEVTVGNTKLASQGSYRCLVSVEDNENATSPAWMDLTGYQVITLNVGSPGEGGWARTWGGEVYDIGNGVATDDFGNVYVTGRFEGTVDFDPGPGEDPHSSNGYEDVFLSKFDSLGNFEWARTWGGTSDDRGFGVTADGSGNVYVTGRFMGTVDFDPGGGDPHTTWGFADVFLSKFDSSGNFEWALTWGGFYYDRGLGVAVDGAGNVYVTGYFSEAAIFPGGSHTSKGYDDVFLCKFDLSGNIVWTQTWGGSAYDRGNGVAADGSGNVYVTGLFQKTVDFDPGGGTDYHTSNGEGDVFLSKFDSTGNFEWARTWGGSDYDIGSAVAADGSENVYVTGRFQGTVDFDPDGGDSHTSNGDRDVFLSKFDSSGNFKWARTWGGPYYDIGYGVAADGSGNVYTTGYFQGTVDFDPGGGIDNHTSNGDFEVFLSKFDSSGNFEWARTWGGSSSEGSTGVAADGSGNVYVTGNFEETADFAPTDPPCNDDPDQHTSNGLYDAFLTKHLPDGCW